MSDIYHRTGRGGAGNFISQKDVVDAANKANAEDIEAQRGTAEVSKTVVVEDSTYLPSDSSSGSTSLSTPYIHSGRGGAGNFMVLPPPPPSTTTFSSASTNSPSTQFHPTSEPSQSKPTYHGRGGAGNWAGGAEGAAVKQQQQEEEEGKRRAALDAGIAAEIRSSLPAPPRIHHLHAPGRGRRPEMEMEGEGLVE
ncbi:hypothetical protein F5Y16DRAFT_360589 [Xylariaceae sp. FL0255]|nr:hypothetical protein F5Y16DRAFT_360589 [Xylariaceae sp. FL0255]